MAITDKIKNLLNYMNPRTQETALGTIIQEMQNYVEENGVLQITADVIADATGGLSIPVPFAMDIYQIQLLCKATVGGGTATVRSGTNAISSAMTCAVDNTVAWSQTLDKAYISITPATALNVITNAAGVRCRVTISGKPA